MIDAYNTELLFISVAKRWLLGDCTVGDRLAYLEWIASRADRVITADVVAAIEPADDTSMEIVSEALRLSLNADDNGSAAFAVLEREDVAGDLLQLNPSISPIAGSITTAVEINSARRGQPASRPPQ